jgi:hypothetical protein
MNMDSQVQLMGVRVARAPVFFPAKDGNPRHNCTLVTVIGNTGTGDKAKAKAYELAFWAKYAEVAAWSFSKGREINVIRGELDSYRIDTGRVKGNGAKEIYLTNKIHVRKFTFGRDSKKELLERVTANMRKLEAEGGFKLPDAVTADKLIEITRSPRVDYNPAIHDATGKYGEATIWKPNMVAAAPALGQNAKAEQIAALEKQIRELGGDPTAATVNAFPEA